MLWASFAPGNGSSQVIVRVRRTVSWSLMNVYALRPIGLSSGGDTMRKGEQTREMILERAAPIFNQQGYAGASLSDIMRETGLEKGGIYNHFRGKEELALAAFDYAIGLVWQQIEQE